jgi:3-oxoacyl-[acyl-carrier protein] reductase
MRKPSVLVTGAAGGIGRACVERFLRDGARVMAVDRQPITWLSALDNVIIMGCDVSSAADCQAAVERTAHAFDGLDALVHCAAIHSSRTWDQLDSNELQNVLNINVGGSFLIAQAAGRSMMKRGSGSILLTSSSNIIAGGVGGAAGMGGPAYVASKAAIVGLVRSLARSLGPFGININGIVPGVTDTPMISNYSAEHRAAQERQSALGRIGKPEDIADVCAFLVSPAARYMTGEMVIVNGGANFG